MNEEKRKAFHAAIASAVRNQTILTLTPDEVAYVNELLQHRQPGESHPDYAKRSGTYSEHGGDKY